MDHNSVRVLIVEDEPELRELLDTQLTAEGFQTILAENGEDALSKVVASKPELTLCDIMMPVMDGYEFLRQVRFRHPELDMMPVIFLTAKDDTTDVMTGLALGVDDYVTKPFDFDLLIARIWARIAQIHRISGKDVSRVLQARQEKLGFFDDIESGEDQIPVGKFLEASSEASLVAICGADDAERKAIEAVAAAAGKNVYSCASGEELITQMAQTPADIVFLSYRTADVAGFYVAHCLKKQREDSLPVIFLAGEETPMAENIALPRPFDDFIDVATATEKFPTLVGKLAKA